MKSAFTFLCVLGVSISAFGAGSSASDTPKLISDSVVSGLSCADLSDSNLLHSVRKERLTPLFHLKFHNYTSARNAGHCWAMSRLQRVFTYLAQTDVSDEAPETEKILNIFQEYVPDTSSFDDATRGNRAVSFEMFRFPLSTAWFPLGQERSLAALWNGISVEAQPGQKTVLNLASALESVQSSLPIQTQGIGYSFELTRNFLSPRSRIELQTQVAKELDESLAGGWTPMLFLAGKTDENSEASAHAVVVQSAVRVNDDTTRYFLYDSNQPGYETTLIFDRHVGFQPGSVSWFPRVQTEIGILDRGEKGEILRAMRSYYSKECQKH